VTSFGTNLPPFSCSTSSSGAPSVILLLVLLVLVVVVVVVALVLLPVLVSSWPMHASTGSGRHAHGGGPNDNPITNVKTKDAATEAWIFIVWLFYIENSRVVKHVRLCLIIKPKR